MQADTPSMDKAPELKKAWVPLYTKGLLANSVEDIDANIESALQRDYTPFNDLIGKKSGAVAIVGSGPSLKKNWHELKRFKGDIIACNSACKFLLDKGVTPQYMMCFDADPLMLAFVVAHPEITYLIASRCPPQAFEMLKDCKVVCWQAGGDLHLEDLLIKYKREEPMVLGGGAAVTRSMYLAITMGYNPLHLYGVDSSFVDGDTHITQSRTVERHLAVKCNERVFYTAPWMTKQAEDFKVLAPLMQRLNGTKFIVHGDGLIPHIAKTMGFKTDEPVFNKFIRVWKRKAAILWQHI
jgi:hypothetical protein